MHAREALFEALKKIFHFSQKHVDKNRKFLHENLKIKAKLKKYMEGNKKHYFAEMFKPNIFKCHH